jgi:hypothetical protein
MVMIPKKKDAAASAAAIAAASAAANPAAAAAATTNLTPGPAAETVTVTTTVTDTAPIASMATTAVAVAAPAGALSTSIRGKPVDVLQRDYKDALTLDWNTLHRIQFNQGSVLDKENSNKSLGQVVEIEMLSWQDSYQISPGTQDSDATEHVRYSDDGVTTNKGENCQEYLAALKEAGYEDAKMTKRVVIGGVLTVCNDPAMVGKMVQTDLSQTSKSQFDRHRMQVAMDISKGLRDENSSRFLKMTATPQSKGTTNWTIAVFGYGTPV